MSSRPASPVLGARYDRRRQRVIDAAAREFARHGYEETSVQQLSDALGMAAGGMYHYFESKQDLLVAICDQIMEPLLGEARTIAAGDVPRDQRLRMIVRLWVAQVIVRQDHMLVFQQQRHAIDASRRWRDVRRSRKAFEGILDDVLADSVTTAAFGGDRRLALSALLGMVNHTAQWYRPRGALTAEQIADGYVDLLLGSGGAGARP